MWKSVTCASLIGWYYFSLTYNHPSKHVFLSKVPHLTLPAVSPTSVSSLPHLYTYTLLSACFLFLYMCFSKSLPLVLSPSGPCPPQSLLYAVPCTLPWEYPFVPIPECLPKFSFQPSRAGFTLTLLLLCVHSTPLPTHMPLFWS